MSAGPRESARPGTVEVIDPPRFNVCYVEVICSNEIFHRPVLPLCSLALPLAADEGMWLFNQFPVDAVNQKYKFQATPEFLDSLRLASVRVAGGSGSFVSSEGLLLTNQHLVAGCLTKLELRPARLPQGRLLRILPGGRTGVPGNGGGRARQRGGRDQTSEGRSQRQRARRPDASAAQRRQCAAGTGVRRQGRQPMYGGEALFGYPLRFYHYKKYTDVRLVFAPENEMAFFGRQRDSLTYLRYGLDVAFLRVYENGKPADTPHFLKWSPESVKEGDLVFSGGSPEPTMRLATAAQLGFYRDTELFFAAGRLKPLIQKVGAFAGENAANLQASEPVLTDLLTNYKTVAGMLIGLRDDRMATRKTVFESKIRRAVQANSKLGMEATKVWDEVAAAYKTWTPNEKPYQLLESGPAPGSNLFRTARQIVRLAEERGKPNDQRLPEYRSGAIEAVEASVNASASLPDALEVLLLTQYFDEMKNLSDRGDKDVPLKAVLGGKSPAEAASELVKSTKLKDPAERKRLAAADKDTVLKSDDVMIRLALAVDEPARRLRKKREELIGSLETSASEKIAQYRLQLFKETEYPDATGTERVEFGVVKTYTDRAGVAMPFASTFSGLYYRRNDEGPYQVPQRWVDRKSQLNQILALDFVSTCDIGGGDPGSPVVNRAGELVGVTFDGNLENLPGVYLYSDEQARAVHVAVEGIAEALDKIYQAQPLLHELGVHPAPSL